MYSTTSAIKTWADTYIRAVNPLYPMSELHQFYIDDNKICTNGEIYICNSEGLVANTLPVQFGKVLEFSTVRLDFKDSTGFPTDCGKITLRDNDVCEILDLQNVCMSGFITLDMFNVLKDLILPRNNRNNLLVNTYNIKLHALPMLKSVDFINIDTAYGNIDLTLQYSSRMDFSILKNLKKIRTLDLIKQHVDSFVGIENLTITGEALINCANIYNYNNIEKMYSNRLQLNFVNQMSGLLNVLFARVSRIIQPTTMQKADYRVHEILEKYINNIAFKLRQEYVMDCMLEFLEQEFMDISL